MTDLLHIAYTSSPHLLIHWLRFTREVFSIFASYLEITEGTNYPK